MTTKIIVLRPEDKEFLVLDMAVSVIKKMLAAGMRVRIEIGKYVESKTPPQHRTVFMWNGEVAAQLTILGALVGSNIKWTKDDAHEMIFKRLCMPQISLPMPDGTTVDRPRGLSDKGTTLEMVAEAMTKYQVWAAEHGIELTEPDASHVR